MKKKSEREIIYPSDLIPFLKYKHLLLDTNVFIDIAYKASKATVYSRFFNKLKESNVTPTTLDVIKYEFYKGSADNKKYQEKAKLISQITDENTIPLTPQTYKLVFKLIKNYYLEGKALSVTDFLLGAILMQYKESICLMTRDTTDFIQRIFSIKSIVNVPYSKGVYTYGIYQYTKSPL